MYTANSDAKRVQTRESKRFSSNMRICRSIIFDWNKSLTFANSWIVDKYRTASMLRPKSVFIFFWEASRLILICNRQKEIISIIYTRIITTTCEMLELDKYGIKIYALVETRIFYIHNMKIYAEKQWEGFYVLVKRLIYWCYRSKLEDGQLFHNDSFGKWPFCKSQL